MPLYTSARSPPPKKHFSYSGPTKENFLPPTLDGIEHLYCRLILFNYNLDQNMMQYKYIMGIKIYKRTPWNGPTVSQPLRLVHSGRIEQNMQKLYGMLSSIYLFIFYSEFLTDFLCVEKHVVLIALCLFFCGVYCASCGLLLSVTFCTVQLFSNECHYSRKRKTRPICLRKLFILLKLAVGCFIHSSW